MVRRERLGERDAARSEAPARSPRRTSPVPRASPKSVTSTRPSRLRSTLCGLKSRCTSPAACAAASPRPPPSTAAQTSSVGGFAHQPRVHARALDELHRDVVAIAVGVDLVDRQHVRVLQPRHRARFAQQALALLGARVCALCNSLIATERSRSGSRAAHTMPMPPAPSTRSSVYLPSRRRARGRVGRRAVPPSRVERRGAFVRELRLSRARRSLLRRFSRARPPQVRRQREHERHAPSSRRPRSTRR